MSSAALKNPGKAGIKVQVGRDSYVDYPYVCVDCTDMSQALTALYTASGIYDTNGYKRLPEILLTELGANAWEAVVRYAPAYVMSTPVTTVPETTGEEFDISTESAHRDVSIATIGIYGETYGDAVDFKGLINVTKDAVNGVDYDVPKQVFSEPWVFFGSDVTASFRRTIQSLCGTVNIAAFRGWEAGEVKFIGAQGQRQSDGNWKIRFSFAVSENATGLVVGDITGIAKGGWQYLWVRSIDIIDGNHVAKKPLQVNVEQIYDDGDFSALGIGTAAL